MPETKILIPGPCGNIEIAYQEGRGSKAFVMCHPHPLFQGNMDNKVVTTTCKAFQELGLATVRFNYRGVGLSEGSYGEGIGEGEDLKAVADWIQQAWKPTELWLGGFSFGGYVAYRMANIIHAVRLLTIGPAVVRLDFKPLPEPTMPWIIIQPEADEIIPPEAVYEFVQTRKNPGHLVKVPQVGHFFHGQQGLLKQLIQDLYHDAA